MIFVAGQMKMNADIMDEFAKDVAAMRPKVLDEDGCGHYSLLVEDKAAGLVNVHEVWADDKALEVHLQQPWVTEFFQKYFGHMKSNTIKVYDIAGAPRDLPGM